MGRFSFQQPPPADAIQYKKLRYVLIEPRPEAKNPRPEAKFWRGKSQKPEYVAFRNNEHRAQYVAQQIAAQDAAEAYKSQHDAERAAAAAAMAEKIQVGSLLHYSWGYEQTNADFFQVVEKRGQWVWIRPIGSKSVPGSEGFMSQRVEPHRDAFLDDKPPQKKKIGPYGLSMDFGSASPIEDGKKVYESWYA